MILAMKLLSGAGVVAAVGGAVRTVAWSVLAIAVVGGDLIAGSIAWGRGSVCRVGRDDTWVVWTGVVLIVVGTVSAIVAGVS